MTSGKIKGRVWKFGDNIDTDLNIPGKYLELVDHREMAKHAMEGIDPDFPEKVRQGDIIVGGRNFGCGSSREHAPLALKYAGISAVVVESFARIFYRNAINIGLPAVECPGITGIVEEGDVITLDLEKGLVENVDKGSSLEFNPLPGFMMRVLDEGGLVPYLKKHIDEW